MLDTRPNMAAVHLNSQQKAAVECEGSVLVLSGAGTGKTRVIVERVRRLLDQGVPPSEILAITYTNKAASEMRTRIGLDARKMMACTFHSFGMRFLRIQHEAAGLPKDFQILDPTEQTQLVRRVLQEHLDLPKPTSGGPEPREVRDFINNMKESGRRPESAVQRSFKDNIEAYDKYEKLRAEEGKTDFAELLLRTVELLRGNESIREEWAKRFTHILIDELQDINQMQFDILSLLRRPETTFFGVGDDDQSIYRFRGALPGMLDRFAKKFVHDRILRLEENYRSTEGILQLANEIIGQNFDRIGKTLRGVAGVGDLPQLAHYATDEEEARSIAREISELRDNGATLSDIGILYRNNFMSQLMEAQLNIMGVPFNLRGGQQFFARAEIKNAVAYLQAAANPNDLDAIQRSVNNPPRKFGEQSRGKLASEALLGRNPLEILEGSTHPGALEYAKIIRDIQQLASKGDLEGATRKAIENLYEFHKERREQERAENLNEVVSVAARYVEAADEPSLVDFLSMIALDQEGPDHASEDRVSMMTIHRAKGLEFERLYLIGLEQGILPGYDFDNDKIAEERRLLYVALTRARRVLRISYTSMRRQRGVSMQANLTVLMRKINPTLLELVNGATLDPVDEIHVGMDVLSSKFGPGRVLALSGRGEFAKAFVLFFRDKTKRWLVLKLAGLRRYERKATSYLRN